MNKGIRVEIGRVHTTGPSGEKVVYSGSVVRDLEMLKGEVTRIGLETISSVEYVQRPEELSNTDAPDGDVGITLNVPFRRFVEDGRKETYEIL